MSLNNLVLPGIVLGALYLYSKRDEPMDSNLTVYSINNVYYTVSNFISFGTLATALSHGISLEALASNMNGVARLSTASEIRSYVRR